MESVFLSVTSSNGFFRLSGLVILFTLRSHEMHFNIILPCMSSYPNAVEVRLLHATQPQCSDMRAQPPPPLQNATPRCKWDRRGSDTTRHGVTLQKTACPNLDMRCTPAGFTSQTQGHRGPDGIPAHTRHHRRQGQATALVQAAMV
jgi:hypothetical protein